MIYLNKSGNIKIGGTENGLPKQYSKMFVTAAHKSGGENFKEIKGFENGVDSLDITLPFSTDLAKNFDVGLISFVILNSSVKYYAKEILGKVYLFPLEPNFSDPLSDMPVILLGEYKDWKDKLQFKRGAILYARIPSVDSSGVFYFKTQSAHSIEQISNTLDTMKRIDSNIIRLSKFKLEIFTKLFRKGDIEEVTYTRLLPPTNENILNASCKISENNKSGLEALNIMEEDILKRREDSIKGALSLELVKPYFGDKDIIIQLDMEADYGSYHTHNKTNNNVDIKIPEELELYIKNIKENYNIPLGLLNTFTSIHLSKNVSNKDIIKELDSISKLKIIDIIEKIKVLEN